MKKVYEAPYLKVVDVKNDIITGSNYGVTDGSDLGGYIDPNNDGSYTEEGGWDNQF